MAGAPTPPRVVKAFGANATAPYITNPLPVASQIGTLPGAASYDDGFVPLNMTDPASGGIPPSGADMNGILYALSAWCAVLQAGQCAQFDAAAATAFGGYAVGAMLASTTPGLFWFNNVDANTNNPDVTPAGWIAWRPTGGQYLAGTAAAGTTNDAAPTGFGFGTCTMDITVSGGNATWTGLVAGTEGQRIVITNLAASSSNLILSMLNGGSLAANQFRGIATVTLLPGMTIQIQYSVGAGKWIVIP